jgi:hypothetical protein
MDPKSRATLDSFNGTAVPAVYTPPGEDAESINVLVLLNLASERWDMGRNGAAIVTRRDEAEFRLDQVRPVRGATVIVGGDSYEVGEILGDDKIIIEVTLR